MCRVIVSWYPIGSNPRFPVGTPEQFAEGAARVKRHAREAGRDPSSLDFVYSANWYDDHEAQTPFHTLSRNAFTLFTALVLS